MTLIKLASTAMCAFAGMFGAPVTVMALMLLAVIVMFCTDIWSAVKPALQSLRRRREFLSRQMRRVNWPEQARELPPIEYKDIKWY